MNMLTDEEKTIIAEGIIKAAFDDEYERILEEIEKKDNAKE